MSISAVRKAVVLCVSTVPLGLSSLQKNSQGKYGSLVGHIIEYEQPAIYHASQQPANQSMSISGYISGKGGYCTVEEFKKAFQKAIAVSSSQVPYRPRSTLQAVKAEDVLPKNQNVTGSVRKGTMGACIMNADIIADPGASEEEKSAALKQIAEYAPGMIALGFSTHCSWNNPDIQDIFEKVILVKKDDS